jgi:serine/threonine protein kinase
MNLCINNKCHKPQNSDNSTFCSNCGSELLIAGKYRVVNQISQNSHSCTYDVREIRDNQSEPDKTLHVLSITDLVEIELLQKIVTALQTIHHPGIPEIAADGYFTYLPRNATSPLHCLIIDKISGVTLDQYMYKQDYHQLDENLVCKWLKETLNILQLLHQQDILHLRINPQNILLQDDGNLALIDIIDIIDIHKIHASDGIGYSPYIPPEQFNNSAIAQSDFFALGMTFAYLLTGKEAIKDPDAYQSDDPKLKWQNFIPATNKITQLPIILDSMMAYAPVQRPQNCQAILNTLDTFAISEIVNSEISNTNSETTISQAENSQPQKRFIWIFIINWVLATLTGTTIGGVIGLIAAWCVSFLLGAVLKNVSTGILLGGVLFGLITGLITGIMQSWVFLQCGYKIKYWMLITSLGFAIEGALGILIGNYNYGGKIMFIPGIAVGISQYLLLRNRLNYSFLWIIINILGGGLAVLIQLKTQDILTGKYQAFSYLLGLIAFGMVTGISFIKLQIDKPLLEVS